MCGGCLIQLVHSHQRHCREVLTVRCVTSGGLAARPALKVTCSAVRSLWSHIHSPSCWHLQGCREGRACRTPAECWGKLGAPTYRGPTQCPPDGGPPRGLVPDPPRKPRGEGLPRRRISTTDSRDSLGGCRFGAGWGAVEPQVSLGGAQQYGCPRAPLAHHPEVCSGSCCGA